MKPPAFQFYADDFIGGTITMTNEERGLYILLLCLQWTQGSVSEEDVQRLGLGMVNGSVLRVRSKFVPDEVDGSLRNTRLESERRKQSEYRAKQAENGKLGGRPKTQAYPKPNPTANPKQSSPSPSPSPSPKEEKKREPRFAPPSLEEVKLVVAKSGLPENDAIWFFHKGEGNGWTNNGKPMKSWQHTVAAWKAGNYFPSQKQPTRPAFVPRSDFRPPPKPPQFFANAREKAEAERIAAEVEAMTGPTHPDIAKLREMISNEPKQDTE